jgi:esterase/lipase superfamily enzyme
MVTVYFATNRNPNHPDNPTDFGPTFSSTGLAELRFGKAEVSGKDLDKVDIEVAPETLATHRAEGQQLGSTSVFDEIRQSMLDGRDTVFTIHGFNYTFQEAIQRTAGLKKRFNKRDMNWLLFTWPSDGKMQPFKAYMNDRIDAAASGPAMARGILKAADFIRSLPRKERCNRRIHLMAHSMGNYVLRHAVQEMRRFVGSAIPRLFDEIILFAPDEDSDALELDHKLGPLQRLGRRTTLYYNMQDVALWISDLTKTNPNRLGDTGPLNPAALPANFTLINASAAVAIDTEQDSTRHQYYLINQAVCDDMLAVLEGRDDISIADALNMRTWRPERKYWRLDGIKPQTTSGGGKRRQGRSK